MGCLFEPTRRHTGLNGELTFAGVVEQLGLAAGGL
jgi:hypothetical protein